MARRPVAALLGGLGVLLLTLVVACGAPGKRGAASPTVPSATAPSGAPAPSQGLLLTYDCSSEWTGRIALTVASDGMLLLTSTLTSTYSFTPSRYVFTVDPALVAELFRRLDAVNLSQLAHAARATTVGSGCVLTYKGQQVHLPYSGIPTKNTAAAPAVPALRSALALLQQIEDRTVFGGAGPPLPAGSASPAASATTPVQTCSTCGPVPLLTPAATRLRKR